MRNIDDEIISLRHTLHRCPELSCRVMEKPFRASEDFGYYLKKCSGAIFYMGNGVDYPEIHTEVYDFPDENLKNISEMFAAICTE